MTTMNTWLPLTDYSTKYKVSVSTLRRRIKTEDIRYRLDDGKYFIVDEPMDSQAKGHRPSLSSELNAFGVSPQQMNFGPTEESVVDVTNRLLSELKRAYTLILAEKEEQMLLLKEEVSDLKTLVRVLEFENDRLKGFKQ